MKRLASLMSLALVAAPAFAADRAPLAPAFASDSQVVPVMTNGAGVGTVFTTYVALMNPTSKAFTVTATLYDNAGQATNATINLAANEVKTYDNFVGTVFSKSGAGTVLFTSPATAGGTHNNRFIVVADVRTAAGGVLYGTSVPTLEFAGSESRKFSAGIAIDSSWRANAGCYNETDAANRIGITIYDGTGSAVGTTALDLAPHAWGQVSLQPSTTVSGGFVRFDPAGASTCYAVVVNNQTNDGRFVIAEEYAP